MDMLGETGPPDNAAAAVDLLLALADMGGSTVLVQALAEVFEIGPPLAADDRRYLAGPVVVHANGWMDSIPKWMIEAIPAERAGIVFGRSKAIVGPIEIGAVMYPATMAAPLYHEHHELYLWATVTAACAHFGRDVDEMWQSLNSRPIRDSDVIERGGHLWDTYRRLAEDIRRKVINAQTQRERTERQVERSVETMTNVQTGEEFPVTVHRGPNAKKVKAPAAVMPAQFSMFGEGT